MSVDHCSHGNAVFQTLNSIGIMDKHDWAVQHSFYQGWHKQKKKINVRKKLKFKGTEIKLNK